MDIKVDFNFFKLVFILSFSLSLCVAQDTFYFNVKPHDQSVVEGTEQTLFCDVSNRRHISFEWIHNGEPVTNTSRRFQEGRNLRILRITREEDSGTFQCIATNVTTFFSLQSGEAHLDIQWLDQEAKVELKRPKPEEVVLGSDIQLKCAITGNPEPRYYWYQNQFQIFNKDNVRIIDKGTRLKITGVTARDNGVYSCRAENVAGAVDSMTNYILNVQAPDTPHLIEAGFTPYKLVLRGAETRLDCPFVNATKVEWFANYEKLTNTSRQTVFENGSLYFPKVRNLDEGGYRCEGLSSQRDIPAQSFTSELIISYLEDFSLYSFEPRLISKFPLVIPVHKESRVKAFLPDGKPKPSHKWLNKNKRQILSMGLIKTEGSDLVFENPQQIDSGNYTFIVNNTAGERRQNVWIIVSVPPIIRKGPQAKQAEEGDSVSFSCQVTGTSYPVTTVIWRRDSQYIKLGSPRHHMDQRVGTLYITNLTSEDTGSYYCVANTTGQQLVSSNGAFLRVRKTLKFKDPLPKNTPLPLNSDAEIKCIAEAELRPTVHWIKGSLKSGGTLDFDSHVVDSDGILYFRGVKMSDAGLYTCVAHVSEGAHQAYINKTIVVDVVESPRFRIRPNNTTVYEEHTMMLHCVASGIPKPLIIWDKNHIANNWDRERVTFLANGTMVIKQVYMEDQGMYGCTANNSAGRTRTEAYVYIAAGSEYIDINRDDENFDMMRTVLIAVCSAGAYLALVIGLTAFCSYRMLIQRRNRKATVNKEKQNGTINHEQHELLMKTGDRDSGGTQCRSDSDNRSHVSGLSSHPSHSSQSQSNSHTVSQSQSQKSHPSVGKTSVVDRLFFPRHELQTMGLLGKSQFGEVYLAKARGIRPGELESQVVIKSLVSKEEQHYFEFNREIDMYSRMDHNNVIRVLGVCREAEPLILITEHCDWGDLKQFLLASRPTIQRIPPLTVIQKIGMCNQIALGMEYLSSQRFVHRDLAARNVLLTSRLELKISSLALSRDLYVNEYIVKNNAVIPLRWLSPEAALEGDYSTKSDVWAFGVYVWEVFHLADLPHKTRSDEELIRALKSGDVTLEISEQCPNEILDLIRRCMSESPKDRPLFTDICNRMGELVTVYSQAPYAGSSSPSTVSFPSSYTGGGVPAMYMT